VLLQLSKRWLTAQAQVQLLQARGAATTLLRTAAMILQLVRGSQLQHQRKEQWMDLQQIQQLAN
jgi:hypothetical protein